MLVVLQAEPDAGNLINQHLLFTCQTLQHALNFLVRGDPILFFEGQCR